MGLGCHEKAWKVQKVQFSDEILGFEYDFRILEFKFLNRNSIF